jgi:hypothetical protein
MVALPAVGDEQRLGGWGGEGELPVDVNVTRNGAVGDRLRRGLPSTEAAIVAGMAVTVTF